MTDEKFNSEIATITRFVQIYCDDLHGGERASKRVELEYNGKSVNAEFALCEECESVLRYAFARLQNCPHDPKPRCRKCKNPCYERQIYKQVAKIMRHSGVKLGLVKLKKKFSL